MLIISKKDIQNIFTMRDAIQASKEALSMYSAGKCDVPLRINIDIPKEQAHSLFMPAYAEELNTAGIKIVSVFPNNATRNLPSIIAQMILLDGQTGEIRAIIDGTYLTQLRTGAVQGTATDVLARKDAKLALLIGAGGQARTQLEALLNVRNLEEIQVYAQNFNQTQQFAFFR